MDVFISYEHQSKSIADNICAYLESKGVRCWYAPRDVVGPYADAIVNAIEQCKVFVLILNHSSSESVHVLNEVEMAYKRIMQGDLTLVPFKVDDGILSKSMEYYVKRLHWIDAVSATLEQAIDQLYKQLIPILGLNPEANVFEQEKKKAETNLDRKTVKYYSDDDFVEIKRLRIEEQLMFYYEKEFYDRLLCGRENLNALDFYVLSPQATVRRLKRPEVDKLACLSYNDGLVAEGNAEYGDNDNIKFYKCDVETMNVEEVLENVLKDMNIDGFDFVNMTMAIMDLKNPFKTLKRIKKFLKPGAVMYVRDVDDGVVFAYPDEKGLFAQFKNFYKLDTLSGSRHSGRQIFNTLKKVGAREVNLLKCGVNNSCMDYTMKRMLFDAWFSFIPNDFKRIVRENPQNEAGKEVLAWLDEYYDDLEEAFFNDDFIFNSGYLFYSVKF